MRYSNTEEFIKKAKKIHGNKYDYSKVVYKTAKEKICIICPEHGEFWQTPNNHLRGQGCPKCGTITRSEKVRKNLNLFLVMAKSVHGDTYDYSKAEYVNNSTPICIICSKHGEFWQRPCVHLRGCGCPKCGDKSAHVLFTKTTEQFVSEAKQIHGEKYDYSKVNYQGNKKKVCIICPEHGEFWQRPNKHLKGQGCPRCVRANTNLSFSEFVEKANEIHKNKYQYNDSAYVNQHTKIKIICPEHGEFWQTPYKHIKERQGCPHCGGRYPCNTEEFIKRANNIHGGKYDYSKVNYINYDTKVCIICPKHGEFWQTPDVHLHGAGCPKCKTTKLENDVIRNLEERHINYIYQHTFEWLRNKGHLFYDFYLPYHKVVIECQGIQHFQDIEFFGGQEALRYTIEKDKIKKELSEQHGIKVYYYSNLDIDYPYRVYTDINELLNEIINDAND